MATKTVKKKTIEEKYKELNELDHILLRPSMWVGSVKEELAQFFIFDESENKMIMQEVTYIPAMLKIVDEVISNSCDEYRRPTNLGLNKLSVTINKDDLSIIVYDNGGIPIVKHKVGKCYLPEFIFGRLRTSSNYDDSEDRQVVGTNGVGSSLSNVFSKKFIIESADKKNKFYRSWSNNMKKLNNDLEITKSKDHYTKTHFYIDFDRFDTESKFFTDDFISIIEKRCIDSAAANIGLTVEFIVIEDKKKVINEKWKFKSFQEYIELYEDFVDMEEMISFSDKEKTVYIFPDNGINVGFVNGAECSKGTHIKAVRTPINAAIAEYISGKKKLPVTAKMVDNKYSLFINISVTNPTYTDQLKHELTTPTSDFSQTKGYEFNIPASFIKNVVKSEIVNIVIDWYKQKQDVEDQKTIRKLNKQAKNKIRNNDKFIDANSKKPAEKQLWIFEGDSARAGFRMARDPRTQAAYLLKGVILNTSGLSASKIMENKELSDIVTILGLQWGTKIDPKKLNFGKIVIATDADFDGSHICGLLLNFFNIWPELYESCVICRSITPIIIATKGTDVQNFYSLDEFKKKEKSLKGYKIKYAKGLGSLSNSEYKSMMQKPRFHYYRKDELSDMNLRLWFNKNIAKERKNAMKGLV